MKNDGLSGAKKFLIILFFLMYLLYGMYFGGFGANSGSMMRFFEISETRQGMIMTVQSLGCIVMAIVLGIWGERLNKLHGLLIGTLIMGVAGLLIGTLTLYTPQGSGYGRMLGYSLLGGIGYITIDLLVNGAVADVYKDRKTTFLPFAHAFYGAGAMLAPLFVSALASPEKPSTFTVPYLVLGILSVVLGIVFFAVMVRVTPETPYADMTSIRKRASANPVEVFRDFRAWQYFLCCFLYLSFQTGLVAWLPKFFEEHFGTGYETANSMLTLYFLGALVIRLLSPAIYKHVPVKRYFLISVGASALVFMAFLLLPSMSITMQRVLLIITGLMQGVAVPSLALLITDDFSDRTASASSVIELGVALAALVAPLMMGSIIEASGYLASMWTITALLAISVLVLATVKKKKA